MANYDLIVCRLLSNGNEDSHRLTYINAIDTNEDPKY